MDKLKSLADATESFIRLIEVDTSHLETTLNPCIIDAIENGKAQKFEYTIELCWKAIKEFLVHHEGIYEASPKKAIKSFYTTGYISEEDYMVLMDAIDDRNSLSHVYDEAQFLAIVHRLPRYAPVLRRVVAVLQQAAPEKRTP